MPAITKDWVDAYFDHGIDKDNRRIFLHGEIEEDRISLVIKSIYYLDSQNQQKPIELFISSNGGCLYEMLALYDVLNTTTCPIHTVAVGKCMSAAPLLVAAGTRGNRYSMPNTQWMIHDFSLSIPPDKLLSIKSDIKSTDEIKSRWASLMETHTKVSAKKWIVMCNRSADTYFNAEEALEWGVVDHLWSEK